MRLIIFLVFLVSSIFGSDLKIESKYFLDSTNTFTIENIYKNKDKFTKSTLENTNFGLTSDTIWIYCKITNSTDKLSSNVLQFPYPLLDYIHILEYVDEKLQTSYITGDLTNFNTRKLDSNDFVFPYSLNPHETKEFIFKVNSEGALNIGLKFLSQEEYQTDNHTDLMVLGIYYGAIIIMLIFNMILFFVLKDRVYFDYFIFHLAYLFLQLGLNGLSFEYFWPNIPDINTYFVPIMLIMASVFSIQFSISFLNLKDIDRKMYSYLKALMLLHLIPAIIIPFSSYAGYIKVIAGLSLVSVSSLFIIGIYILMKYRTTSSKFYVVAWSFLLIGVLATEFQNIGLLPTNTFTLYSTQIGAFCELALLSFALGHRYNTVFMKLHKTQEDLQVLNKELEFKIEERTKDINEKNNTLSQEVKNKNILLKELYHRVKNNLQIISSLMSLQLIRIKDKDMKDILVDMNQRIKSISILHEKLFESDNLEYISMKIYIEELIKDIQMSFHTQDIEFIIDCKNINIDLERAVPLGLITNELITNAIKYAFTEQQETKCININIKSIDEEINLTIADNGKGLESDSEINNGFGSKLLKTLVVSQLKGTIEYKIENGLQCSILFPIIEVKR